MFLPVFFYSCGQKKNGGGSQQAVNYDDPQAVLQQTKSVLGSGVKFAYKGLFDRDSVLEIAAGTEVKNNSEWGIKFYLLKLNGNKLQSVFQTDLMNGSFKECLVQKIKFPGFDHELIYYNSQDYFLGSGGGEVYSYVVNYLDKKVYYAHLVTEPGRPVSLYLSDNIDVPEIKAFFASNFKRDFPSVKIVSKDVVLKY